MDQKLFHPIRRNPMSSDQERTGKILGCKPLAKILGQVAHLLKIGDGSLVDVAGKLLSTELGKRQVRESLDDLIASQSDQTGFRRLHLRSVPAPSETE